MCLTRPQHYVHNQQHYDALGQEILDLQWGCNFEDKCNYINDHKLKEIDIGKNDISIVQLNIRGLIGKQISFSNLLSTCNHRKLDIGILSETWLTKSSVDRVLLPGYEYVSATRDNKKGGGVGIIINKNLKYKVQHDLHICNELFENFSIELKVKNQQIVISSLYRPPNTNQRDFIHEFKKLQDIISKEKQKEWIIGLDHNMDFLKSEINSSTQDFLEFLVEKELYPVITCPTRITKTSATLIDNIIMSRTLYSKSHNSVLINDLSDHLPCISIICGINTGKGETITITKRNMKGDNMKLLKASLSSLDWTELATLENPSEQFDLFHSKLIAQLDCHCPEKKHTIPDKFVYKEPWITKGYNKEY